jgi:transcriptional regulator with XRE-family HTH domain
MQLRELRRHNNLTQREIAAVLGYKRSAIESVESGRYAISITMLVALHKKFNISIDEWVCPTESAARGSKE